MKKYLYIVLFVLLSTLGYSQSYISLGRIDTLWGTGSVPKGTNLTNSFYTLYNAWKLGGTMSGQLKYSYGTPINGYVMTSDGVGNATWAPITSSGDSGVTSGYGVRISVAKPRVVTLDTTIAASQSRLTKALVPYQKSISLTTTGASGAATLVGSTLNIPIYVDSAVVNGYGLKKSTSGTKITLYADTTVIESQTRAGKQFVPYVGATKSVVLGNTLEAAGVLGDVSLSTGSASNYNGSLIFYNGNNVYTNTIVPGSPSGNLTLTLPATQASTGQVLYSTDNAGTLGWTTASSDSGAASGYGIRITASKPRVFKADTTLSTGLVSKGRLTSALYPYQKNISLTTTGTSGAATFSSNTLNVPQYQAAYTNLTSIGSLSNSTGYLYNNGSGTFSYGTLVGDSGIANSWGLKITAAKPRLFKVDTTTGNSNGARIATQYWVKQNGSSGWGLTGNSGTTVGTNFIGTTDNVGLMFKTNGIKSGSIDLTYSNTSFGSYALYGNTTGSYNTMFGVEAGRNVTGGSNIGIGRQAFDNAVVTGSHNICIGYQSNVGTSSYNIAIGDYSTAGTNSSSTYNLTLGFQAGGPTTGSNNTCLGSQSAYYSAGITGSNNTFAGCQSGYNVTGGANNTAVGAQALYTSSAGNTGFTGSNNTVNGYQGGYNLTTGSSNTLLGITAGSTLTTGSNNTIVGASSDVSSGSIANSSCLGQGITIGASNTIVLGNTSVTHVVIGQTTGSYLLDVKGGDIACASVGYTLRLHKGSAGDMFGDATLSSGTVAVTISGLASTDRAFVQITSASGTISGIYTAVCTTNTLTITAINTAGSTVTTDNSTLTYHIIRPY